MTQINIKLARFLRVWLSMGKKVYVKRDGILGQHFVICSLHTLSPHTSWHFARFVHAVFISGKITFGFHNILYQGAILSFRASQHVPSVARTSETCPPHTSFWGPKDSVWASWALPFPVDHSDVQSVVAEGLQPRQHAVGLAALESEDLFLNVASVSFWWILCLPVVNLKQQEQQPGMYKEANKIKVFYGVFSRKFLLYILEDYW